MSVQENLPRLTEIQYHTFNQICSFKASNRRMPSYQELKEYMGSPSTRLAIKKRMLALVKKGYLKLDEEGYTTTGEGVSQAIKDWADSKQRIKRPKNSIRYDSYRAEVLPRQLPN